MSGFPDLDVMARGRREQQESQLPALDEFVRVSGFIQQTPTDGLPATRRTDVYLGYDDRAFHCVFLAFDDEPERVRARMASRENVDFDDVVTLLLDTDNDRRRAYAFRANPLGVQWDALWTEGQGFDTSFDAVWRSEGRRTSTGYVVWFEIPFRSLRFPTAGDRTWRIVLSRSVPRDQGEVSYWPRVSSEIQGTLTQSAELIGLDDVSPGRNIQAIPYTTARSFRTIDPDAAGGPQFVGDDAELDAGGDLKAVFDERFVLDVTVNPDFSQVESDEPQVTVNRRFEVSFPERRPFFTENADLFRTPVSVVFTRRIADPQLGARFTGKAGAWDLGALVIDDQAPGRVGDGAALEGERAWFNVVRLSRDIGAFSRFGGVYTGRSFGGGANRVAGADGRLRIGDRWSATGQVLASRTEEPQEPDVSGQAVRAGRAIAASVSRPSRHFSYAGSFVDITRQFEAQAGFVPRTDVREMGHFASYFFRPDSALLSWGPELSIARRWDHAGELLDEVVEPSFEWNFVGGSSFEVNYAFVTERLRPEDHPALTETRAYDASGWDIEYGTSYLDWLELDGNLRIGKQIHLNPLDGEAPSEADLLQLDFELTLLPVTRLRIDNAVLWTWLDEPDGGARIFTDRILRTRWSWQFTRELSVRAILQYEHTTTDPRFTSLQTSENLNADFLVTYRPSPWTAIYGGVNTNGRNVELVGEPGEPRRLVRVDGLRNDGHQLFLKISYLLRF